MIQTSNTESTKAKPEYLRNGLVIGKGHLGSYLRGAWGCMQWNYEMADLTQGVLDKVKPSFVVNAAGKTNLNWCEVNGTETYRCNVIEPLRIFRLVRDHFKGEVPHFNLSSGCLFDGPYSKEGKPFSPYDEVSPASLYAWTKASCDALMTADWKGNFIIRPRQLYSGVNSPRNTLTKLIGYPKLLDTDNSMTSVRTVQNTIEKILETHFAKIYVPRIFHVYEKGITSPYKVGMLLAEAGLRDKPEILTKDQLDEFHKPKRVDTVLQDLKFEEIMGDLLPTVEQELRDNIQELKRNMGK